MPTAPVRTADAASVLLVDRSDNGCRVLMGRRSRKHVFMPEVYVFPGGRRDRTDAGIPVSGDLHPLARERLELRTGKRVTQATLRAIAIAGLRELHEEAGLTVGTAPDSGTTALPFLPDLSRLRFLARAITPPGHVRRFDTRFFTLFTDEAEIDPASVRGNHELEDLRWIDVFDASGIEMADITVLILEELRICLQEDSSLPYGRAAAFFHTRRGQFVRERL
ncbi:hydrolase [Sinorhizobium sp. BG8]|uniref:NUDIX hydrolase n=1 Tax=Sinorhizobium sp. BG8 TaxID=2613773 RepID=UPI001FEDBDC4|nr:hydrolase [Sinorhizobium sp. BG8]